MKTYRLKQWYPGLSTSWKVGDEVCKKEADYGYTLYPNCEHYIPITHVETFPEFWEEIIKL